MRLLHGVYQAVYLGMFKGLKGPSVGYDEISIAGMACMLEHISKLRIYISSMQHPLKSSGELISFFLALFVSSLRVLESWCPAFFLGSETRERNLHSSKHEGPLKGLLSSIQGALTGKLTSRGFRVLVSGPFRWASNVLQFFYTLLQDQV